MVVFRLAVLLSLAASQPHTIMFHYPRWSPDGAWLVLTANIDGDDEEVWIVSGDGTQKRKLTDNAVGDTAADWLPDGRIVFQRHAAGKVEHLVMNADGSGERTLDASAARATAGLILEERQTADGQAVILTHKGGKEQRISGARWAEQPSLSPDGRFVAFEQRDRPHAIVASDIAIWDLSAGRLRVFARGTDPSWSPDGRSLLFKTPRGTDNTLFVTIADVATGQQRTLAAGVHPHFAPDGRSIAFMADRPDRADVYVIGTDGTGQRCLTCSWKR